MANDKIRQFFTNTWVSGWIAEEGQRLNQRYAASGTVDTPSFDPFFARLDLSNQPFIHAQANDYVETSGQVSGIVGFRVVNQENDGITTMSAFEGKVGSASNGPTAVNMNLAAVSVNFTPIANFAGRAVWWTTTGFPTKDLLMQAGSTTGNQVRVSGDGSVMFEHAAGVSGVSFSAAAISGRKLAYDAQDTDQRYSLSGHNIEAHGDVSRLSPLLSGHQIGWNGTSWVNTTPGAGGGSGDLDGLSDTNLGTLVSGHVLSYNGTEWINADTTAAAGGGEALSSSSSTVETKTLIERIALTAAGTFTFSSIPDTYDHLELRGKLRLNSTGADSLEMQFNGDTVSTNYRTVAHNITDTGTHDVAAADNEVFGAAPGDDATAGVFGDLFTEIRNYRETGVRRTHQYRTALRQAAAESLIRYGQTEWESTDAITSILIESNDATPSFVSGSIVELYGIKQESVVTDVTGGALTITKETNSHRVLIQEIIADGTSPLIEWSGISQDYQHLDIVYTAQTIGSSAAGVQLQANFDIVSGNYTQVQTRQREDLSANQDVTISQEVNGGAFVSLVQGDSQTNSDHWTNGTIDIPYATEAGSHKIGFATHTNWDDSNGVEHHRKSWTWSNRNEAISGLTLRGNADFATGSKFSLYGVKPIEVVTNVAGTIAGNLIVTTSGMKEVGTVLFSSGITSDTEGPEIATPALPTGYHRWEIYLTTRSDRAASAESVRFEFNGDTTLANYRRSRFRNRLGSVSGDSADTNATVTCVGNEALPGEYSMAVIHMHYPTSTLFNKTAHISNRIFSTNDDHDEIFQTWESTAAISGISFTCANGANFVSGSQFQIIGYAFEDVVSTIEGTVLAAQPSLTVHATAEQETSEIFFESGLTATSPATEINLPAFGPIVAGTRYNRIELEFWGKSDRSADQESVYVEFNGDTTDANYQLQEFGETNGSTAATDTDTRIGFVIGAATSDASQQSYTILKLHDPFNTTFYKGYSAQFEARGTTNQTFGNRHTVWESTAAISGISLKTLNTSNFTSGTYIRMTGFYDQTIVSSGTYGDLKIINGVIVP